MGMYSIKGKKPRDVSREDFYSTEDGTYPNQVDYAKIGSLQRIADSMERLVELLECYRVRGALDAVIRMDKRMAKSRPLGSKRK